MLSGRPIDRLGLLLAAFLPVLLAPSATLANSFAPDGTYRFDSDAIYSEGFESFVPDPSFNGEIVEDPNAALEGVKMLKGASGYATTAIGVALPAIRDVYRATVWIRGSGLASAYVGYADGTPAEYVPMYPTGRITSDDWCEVSSAPFSVDGPRGAQAAIAFFGGILADAIEVKRDPTSAFSGPRPCMGVSDSTCGGDGVCMGGWCRNANAWVPALPDADHRRMLAEYLENRLTYFAGPYQNRERYLPSVRAEMRGARTATTPWRFWNSFVTAVHRLQDWHSETNGVFQYVVENLKPLNVCFFEGDADLTHGQAPKDADYLDVVVSHTGPDHTWGLKRGDRLVAIDGRHPIAWMRSLIATDWGYHASNDPTTMSDFAERMAGSIGRYARTITVVRCQGASCGQLEDIDVTAIAPETSAVRVVSCDHRPTYIVSGPPASHSIDTVYGGRVVGTTTAQNIWGMVWNNLMGGNASDKTEIQAQVDTWRLQGAKGVLLDHRTGNGGTIDGPGPIIEFAQPVQLFGLTIWHRFMDEEGPKSLADGLALIDKYRYAGTAWVGGSSSASLNVPVALLVTRDGSASDYFAYAMKGAPKVRIFGPHATAGAFSSFMGLSYWMGVSYQVAAGDTIGHDGLSLCGHGVLPDQIVLPKQSDLVQGHDTLAEQALSWILSQVTP